ncbi:50S ribosomal protein L35 [Candidatus Falkowbacteria bacterium]|jgi:large subunit ribosomal protein L35|nr:MAG: 50S ribosomal protein L35 [Candidatus Falkowbacteria bacterium]
MPKIKTHKATAKRFTLTKTKKLRRRKAGQDHFNSRESGKVVRNKRRDIFAHSTDEKNVRSFIPYKK